MELSIVDVSLEVNDSLKTIDVPVAEASRGRPVLAPKSEETRETICELINLK